MPTNSPGHEGRTDLYEKAKVQSKGMQQLNSLMAENHRLQEFNSYGRATDAPGKERDLASPRWYDAHPEGPDSRTSHLHQGLVDLGGDIGSYRPGELTQLGQEMLADPNHPAHEGLHPGLVKNAEMLHAAYKAHVRKSGAQID